MNSNTQQIQPLTCHGHTRPVVDLQFSVGTTSGSDAGPLLISSCKGKKEKERVKKKSLKEICIYTMVYL